MRPAEQHSVDLLIHKLQNSPDSVTWKDLVSDPQTPHSPLERDQVLKIGTLGHQASPTDLFRGWERPWFFWSALKAGAFIIAACFAVVYGCQLMFNTTTQLSVEMLFLIPPMVVPLVLMIFFWELNVPRNLTIWDILLFFLVGTLLSLAGNAMMFVLVGNEGGSWAALREEPAKLLAGIALMHYCTKVKGKQICGLTGLVIGAAVGSGFSAFETISYGLHYDVSTVMARVCFAVVGHTLYSCSYLAALALHTTNGQITLDSFRHPDFAVTFGCSVLCHALWNSSFIPMILKFAVTLYLLWFSALWITRKCLRQVLPGRHTPGSINSFGTERIELRCIRGSIAGKKWSFASGQIVTVGRGSGNLLNLPDGINGISRKHCYLEERGGCWYVTDTHSSFGTFLQLPGGSTTKLIPGKQYKLPTGAILCLGSRNFCLAVSLF